MTFDILLDEAMLSSQIGYPSLAQILGFVWCSPLFSSCVTSHPKVQCPHTAPTKPHVLFSPFDNPSDKAQETDGLVQSHTHTYTQTRLDIGL